MKTGGIDTRKLAIGVAAVPFLLLVIYPLSFGPILWLLGIKPGGGWNSIPEPYHTIYTPLSSMPLPEFVARSLDQYTVWWMNK